MPNVYVTSAPVHLEASITKTDLLRIIEENATKAVEQRTTTFSVIYSGHG